MRFCSSLYSEGHLGVHAGGSQTRTGINHVCLAESEEFHAVQRQPGAKVLMGIAKTQPMSLKYLSELQTMVMGLLTVMAVFTLS